MNKGSNQIVKVIVSMIFIFAMIGMYSLMTGSSSKVDEISYIELESKMEAGTIEEVTVQESYGVYQASGKYTEETESGAEMFKSTIPAQDEIYGDVIQVARDNNVKMSFEEEAHTSPMQDFLGSLIFLGLMILAMVFLMNKMAGGKNSPMKVGENKAQKVTDSKVTFDDVIGLKEEKQELVEIIDFLKNPKKYNEMGAKIPNGVLLEGPPGTGKTLMAKAIAGEANVPFYSISGSDFIEMFVGVGASRVRSLFKEAKKEGSAIVFIDEIDAIGSRDTGAPGGRNTEQEQTINALLVELDGFASAKGGVIIIGATNRADKLDKALLRPGRFDRKVMVGLPNLKEREAILNYHSAKRKFSNEVDFGEVAKVTTGMSGAELEAVVNEAAILAVRDDRKEVGKADIVEAVDRVQMGPAKITNKYTKKDKEMVSYHESGHAIIGLSLEDAMQVQKITIIPRGNAGGYVAFTPKDEQRFTTKKQLEDQLVGLLGGRSAEEVFLNEISIGAHNDLERATQIARAMVTEYGMSDLGLYQFHGANEQRNLYSAHPYSNEMAEAIDAEINKILNRAHERARQILIDRSEDMHLLAKTIREVEVLEREDIEHLLAHGTLQRTTETTDQEEVSQDEISNK